MPKPHQWASYAVRQLVEGVHFFFTRGTHPLTNLSKTGGYCGICDGACWYSQVYTHMDTHVDREAGMEHMGGRKVIQARTAEAFLAAELGCSLTKVSRREGERSRGCCWEGNDGKGGKTVCGYRTIKQSHQHLAEHGRLHKNSTNAFPCAQANCKSVGDRAFKTRPELIAHVALYHRPLLAKYDEDAPVNIDDALFIRQQMALKDPATSPYRMLNAVNLVRWSPSMDLSVFGSMAREYRRGLFRKIEGVAQDLKPGYIAPAPPKKRKAPRRVVDPEYSTDDDDGSNSDNDDDEEEDEPKTPVAGPSKSKSKNPSTAPSLAARKKRRRVAPPSSSEEDKEEDEGEDGAMDVLKKLARERAEKKKQQGRKPGKG